MYRSITGTAGDLTGLLYHRRVLSKSIAALVSAAAALTLLVGVLAGEAGVPDRLERFRALAAARLAPAQLTDETAAETYREIYKIGRAHV